LPIIAVVSEEQTQILKYNPFDINDKDLQMVHRIYGLQANSIAFHPSLPILAVTSLNRISLWLCEPVHKYRVKELHFDMGSTIECIAFHPNPELNYMAAVSRNRTRVWNIEPIIKQLLSENPFKILITIFGNIANTLIHRFTIEQQQIVFRPRFVRWILSRVLTTVFPEGVHITDDSLYDILKLFFIINPRDHTGIPLKTLFPPKRGGGSKRMKRTKWTIKKLKKPISRKMKIRNKSINRRNRK
jgi:WD40 repeat protein